VVNILYLDLNLFLVLHRGIDHSVVLEILNYNPKAHIQMSVVFRKQEIIFFILKTVRLTRRTLFIKNRSTARQLKLKKRRNRFIDT
jgi:hypothetical protein